MKYDGPWMQILAIILVFVLILGYAGIGGVTAVWVDSFPLGLAEGGPFFVGMIWPLAVPFLFGAEINRQIERRLQ